MDNTELYRQTRLRVTELCRTSAGDGSGFVPACPDWSVALVVAHLSGVCGDILAGNIADAGQDHWTEQQVSPRVGRSLDDLLDEWTELGEKAEAALAGGHAPAQLLFDTTAHEQDIRGALHQPGARDDEAHVLGWSFVLDALDQSVRSAGLGPLQVLDGRYDRVVGGDQPAATVTISPFEGVRAASGRRTATEMTAYQWTGADPGPWVEAFPIGPFSPSKVSLDE